jgi:hypothetical protein
MERKRPGALTAIAVLNIVFGSLGLICSCLYSLGVGVLMIATPNNPDPRLADLGRIAEVLKREIPSYLPIEISMALYFVLVSSLLIVAGIGLLYIARWARVLCFIFSVTTILALGAYLAYIFIVFFPTLARIGGDPVEGQLSKALRLGGVGLIIIYTIVLIVVLCQRSIASAFSPRTFGDDHDQRGFDDEYDEYVRE